MLRAFAFAVFMIAAFSLPTLRAVAGRDGKETDSVAACTQLADPVKTIEGCTALLGVNDIGDRIRAAVLHLRGVAHETRGSFDLAIGDFAAARELDPKEPAPIMGLAVILSELRHSCFEEKRELKVIEGCSLLIANAAMAHLADDIVARAQAARTAVLGRRTNEPSLPSPDLVGGPAKAHAAQVLDKGCGETGCTQVPAAEAPTALPPQAVAGKAKTAEAGPARRRKKKLASGRLNSAERAMAGLRGVSPDQRRRR